MDTKTTTTRLLSIRRKGSFSKIKDEASILKQSIQWLFGINKHNPVRDECCPDFSCCVPTLYTKPKERLTYLVKYYWIRIQAASTNKPRTFTIDLSSERRNHDNH